MACKQPLSDYWAARGSIGAVTGVGVGWAVCPGTLLCPGTQELTLLSVAPSPGSLPGRRGAGRHGLNGFLSLDSGSCYLPEAAGTCLIICL